MVKENSEKFIAFHGNFESLPIIVTAGFCATAADNKERCTFLFRCIFHSLPDGAGGTIFKWFNNEIVFSYFFEANIFYKLTLFHIAVAILLSPAINSVQDNLLIN